MMLIELGTVTKDTDNMTPNELAALANSLTDDDIQIFLTLVKDRLTVWVPAEHDDSVYPAKVSSVYSDAHGSVQGVSLLLEDEDDE
tara:strand:+ start:575 stop:832 length:258 start_codon:yes stop_codon:yes gene_type:complete